MSCIKTGADVYLPEYGALVHGDLFQVGQVYILACGTNWRSCCLYAEYPFETRDMKANMVAYDFQECGPNSIAMEYNTCSRFHYDGEPI